MGVRQSDASRGAGGDCIPPVRLYSRRTSGNASTSSPALASARHAAASTLGPSTCDTAGMAGAERKRARSLLDLVSRERAADFVRTTGIFIQRIVDAESRTERGDDVDHRRRNEQSRNRAMLNAQNSGNRFVPTQSLRRRQKNRSPRTQCASADLRGTPCTRRDRSGRDERAREARQGPADRRRVSDGSVPPRSGQDRSECSNSFNVLPASWRRRLCRTARIIHVCPLAVVGSRAPK